MHNSPGLRTPRAHSPLHLSRIPRRGYLTRMALRYRSRSPFALWAAILMDMVRLRSKHSGQIARSFVSLIVTVGVLISPFSTTYTTYTSYAPNVASNGSSLAAFEPKVPLGGVRSNELLGGCNPSEILNTPSCGDPIKTATGNFWETITDFAIAGRGPGLLLSRTYNSTQAGGLGSFGYGWTFNYNMFATRGTSTWYVVQENSSALQFDTGSFGQDPRVLASWDGNLSAATLTRKQGQMSYHFTNYDDPCCGQYHIWRLDQITDRNGYTTTLAYEPVPGQSSGVRLHSATDMGSRSLLFSYGDTIRPTLITRVSDPISRTVGFGYDSLSNLTVVTDVNGLVTQYAYDTNHRLQTITQPNGAAVSNEYDSYGRVLTQTLPLNRKTRLEYSGAPGMDGACNPITTRVTDTLGLVNVYEYGPGCQLASATFNATAPAPQQAKWRYYYNDPIDYTSVTSVTDPLSNTWAYTWGKDYGNPYYVKSNGNLLSVTDPLSRTTQYAYNSTNDRTIITDTRGLTTTLTYDTYGNVTRITQPLTETSQLISTTLAYDPVKHGDVLTVTNPLGNNWTARYNDYGYVITATNPLTESSRFSYNSIGWLTAATSPRNYTSTYTYTTYGEPYIITDTLGYTTVYTYDDVGNPVNARDANGRIITNTFNLNNELTRATHPDNTHSDYGYDGLGRTITQTNGLGQLTQYAYNDTNRVITYTDALTRSTVSRFDLAGNLSSVTDAKNQTTTLGYDAAYQLKSVDYSDTGTPDVSLLYNNMGMRTVMTDGTGTSRYIYDSLLRLTSVADGHADAITYTYDLASRPITITYPYNGVSDRNVVRGYNAANRMTSVKDWLNNTTSFAYNVDGALTTITRPNSVTTSVGYDAADQPLTKTDAITSTPFLSFTWGIDPVGVLTSSAEANTGGSAGTHTYNYDTRYRLTQDSFSPSTPTTNTWQYDAATQILTTTYQSGSAGAPINGARTFDAANQIKTLTEVQGGTTLKNLSYTFDNNGNRASRYDKIPKTTTTYGYDQADRLIAAGDAQYTYNGDGLRMSKTVGDQPPINFSWDIGIQAGLPLLLQEATGSYIYGPGGMLIEKIGPPPSGLGSDAPFWYHTDRVGSIRAITNGSGALVNTYTYDAYGKTLTSTGSLSNPFGYTGEYTDSESGFLYLRARYYDPESQQFLTVDPALAWTEEAYAYVGGSPTNFADPSGLCRDGDDSRPPSSAECRRQDALQEALIEISGCPGDTIDYPPWDGVCESRKKLDDFTDSVGMTHADLLVGGFCAAGGIGGGGSAGRGSGGQPAAAMAAKATGPQNRINGNAFRDLIADIFRKNGFTVRTEVYKRTPFGGRYIDIEVSKNGVILGGIETKTGGARYDAWQRAKDAWLLRQQGYIVMVVRDK